MNLRVESVENRIRSIQQSCRKYIVASTLAFGINIAITDIYLLIVLILHITNI